MTYIGTRQSIRISKSSHAYLKLKLPRDVNNGLSFGAYSNIQTLFQAIFFGYNP